MSPWRLLVTRAEPEASEQCRALAAQGVFASALPTLEIQPLAMSDQQRRLLAQRYDAVIVVSKAAARLCLAHLSGQPQPAEHWFAVGEGTGRLLAGAGLGAHWPLRGEDSEALLALPELTCALAGPCPRVLIVRGQGGRELLAGTLRERGAHVDYLELYRRACPAYAPGELAARAAAERLNGLVVSSGQGLEHLHALAAEQWPALAGLALFAPGERVAALARQLGARQVIDCRGASTAALVSALAAHSPGATS